VKVLIVEDEAYILNGILSMIRNNVDFPIKLSGVLDSKKALAKARSFCPDLVITDIVMPNLIGLDLIKGIKTERICEKIIIISAHDEFQYAQKAIKLGVLDYLTKPIDKAKLLEDIYMVNASIQTRQCETTSRMLPDIPFLRECSCKPGYPDSLKKILKYVNAYYSRDISLVEISEKFSLNTNYVSTLFTKHMGQCFLQYLNQVRIRKAVELLLYEQAMSIVEISYAVGYFNERRMYRSFKKFLDMTPGDIRKGLC
jgi:two-component system, response regulator YesN